MADLSGPLTNVQTTGKHLLLVVHHSLQVGYIGCHLDPTPSP